MLYCNLGARTTLRQTGVIKMIKIVAKCFLKEGMKEEFKKATVELIAGSRAEEGNISYVLFEDIANPNVMAFIEEWRDEKAIEEHNATPHFIKAGEAFGKFFAAPLEVTLYREA